MHAEKNHETSWKHPGMSPYISIRRGIGLYLARTRFSSSLWERRLKGSLHPTGLNTNKNWTPQTPKQLWTSWRLVWSLDLHPNPYSLPTRHHFFPQWRCFRWMMEALRREPPQRSWNNKAHLSPSRWKVETLILHPLLSNLKKYLKGLYGITSTIY